MVEGVDPPLSDTIRVGVDDQVEAQLGGGPVPELDHLPELPGGVHVQYRERDLRPGKNALRATCRSTDESLPMEYIITGRSNWETTSRMMWMASASKLAQVGEAQLRWQRGGPAVHSRGEGYERVGP